MAKCLECGKEFEGIRISAKYCSPACRKAAFLKSKIDLLDTPEEVEKKIKEIVVTPEIISEARRFEVIGKTAKGKGRVQQDMYFCGVHREHCKHYCQRMCDERCVHIMEGGVT